MTGRRFLFIVHDSEGHSGGTAVLYDCAHTLAQSGYRTAIVHGGRRAFYRDTPHAPQRLYTHDLRRAFNARMRLHNRLKHDAEVLKDALRGGPNPRWRPESPDIIVVPEYMLAEVQGVYPDHDKIVFVQNPFYYATALALATERGLDPHRRVLLHIGVSRNCMDALDVAGAAPVAHVPVAPDLPRFPFCEGKARKIAYMPRKRRHEAALLIPALRRRGRLMGYELVEIDGAPQDRVASELRESLFFLSLLHEESLGFPAMEAMSAGCVTVGYTGLGATEYFDDTTGIPVADGDTGALIVALEGAIAEYEADPRRLDDLRRAASERINTRYARPIFEQALHAAWARVDAR